MWKKALTSIALIFVATLVYAAPRTVLGRYWAVVNGKLQTKLNIILPGGKVGIGNFIVPVEIFNNIDDIDQGMHICGNNPGIVLEDTNVPSGYCMSITAGSGNKLYLITEKISGKITHFKINNDDDWIILTDKITIGDGTGTKELHLTGANGLTTSTLIAFNETSELNNSIALWYDSSSNRLDFWDYTASIKQTLPLLTIKRDDDPHVGISHYLKIRGRVGNPAKPGNNESIIWVSDGSGLGSNGDIMAAATISGTTRYIKLFDYSAGTIW